MAEPNLELIQTMLERLLDGQRFIMGVLDGHGERLTSLDQKVALLAARVGLLHRDLGEG